ncbi:MAG: hypothetical protein ABEJ04_01510 [Halobacteriaceae archaeon]
MSVRHLDYPDLAKLGFVAGAGLLVLGAVGQLLSPTLLGHVPSLFATLFTDFEAVGILVAVFSVFGFGIVLPLVE